MTTQRNPENKQEHRPHDLGQITLRHDLITIQNLECWIESAKQDAATGGNAADTAYYLGQVFAYEHILEVLKNGFDAIHTTSNVHNPNPWVVVENAGTDNENLVIDFATFREASNYIDRNYTDDDCPADIMRRRDDGVLTTEF